MQTRRDICPRCSTAVYAAEMVIGPERKSYHKLCLACASCKTRLAPGSFHEHDGEPFCRNCHRRLFAPRDLRSANLPSADNSFSSETEIIPKDEQGSRTAVRDETRLKNQEDTSDMTSSAEASNITTTSPAVSPAISISGSPIRAGPRRSFGGPRVECPRCQKAVYQAEQVLAVGKKWHRACLQCVHCSKRLDTHNLSDKDGEPYCRSCYAKNYGPAGSGYALLGKAGG